VLAALSTSMAFSGLLVTILTICSQRVKPLRLLRPLCSPRSCARRRVLLRCCSVCTRGQRSSAASLETRASAAPSRGATLLRATARCLRRRVAWAGQEGLGRGRGDLDADNAGAARELPDGRVARGAVEVGIPLGGEELHPLATRGLLLRRCLVKTPGNAVVHHPLGLPGRARGRSDSGARCSHPRVLRVRVGVV
jgi:hypothetical protein